MKFDESYELLEDMYADRSFPRKQTDQMRNLLRQVIKTLEQGERSPKNVQAAFDRMTEGMNRLMADCPDAEEIVAADVLYILDWFDLSLDVEDALRKRTW